MKTTEPIDPRSAVRTTAVALSAAIALWLLGRGTLSTPPVGSWGQLQQWLADRSTATAAIAALRAAAAVASGYLAGVSALTIVARLASLDQLDRVARELLPRSLRPLIGLAVGAGVVTAAASMTVPRDRAPTRVATATLEAPSDATATMYLVSDLLAPTSTAAEAVATTTIAAPAVTAASIPTTMPPTSVAAAPVAASPTATVVAAPTAARAADADTHTWTIARGEHLWAVASETLADSWHRAPSDAEIVPYWRELIEVNRGRLIDSANPDYVLVGQTFVLPNVPAAPR